MPRAGHGPVAEGSLGMQWLDSDGQKRIHTNVLRILAEVGLEVQHPKLLDALAGDRTTDLDRARGRYREIMADAPDIVQLTPDEEYTLRRIIANTA